MQQLIESFGTEDVSIDEISRQLSADPALSAKLLRLANSAYFNLSRTIGSVDDALRMLGFVMVRNLVLGNGIAAAFRHTPGIQMSQFWRYNLYTACVARWLASKARPPTTDLAFTVGLLHGVGQLQMHAVIPKDVAPLDRQTSVLAPGRAELESQALGFHHGEVAAELARYWNLPPPIVVALRDVPHPLDAPEFSEPAALVHLGAWRARTEVLASARDDALASYPGKVGERLGIAPDWAPALVSATEAPNSQTMPRLDELTEGLEAMLA